MRRALCLASSFALVLALASPPAAGAFTTNGACEGFTLSQGTLELRPGFWAEGSHSHGIRFAGPGFEDRYSFDFTVDRDAPLYPGQVWLAWGS